MIIQSEPRDRQEHVPAVTFAERMPIVADSITGCWMWIGTVQRTRGYGRWNYKGRHATRPAHAVVWEIYNGMVPYGKEMDHLCRNKRCVNPRHLEPVDHIENVMRGESRAAKAARRITCKYGHPYDAFNTCLTTVTRRGKTKTYRKCRTCDRESHRRNYKPRCTSEAER